MKPFIAKDTGKPLVVMGGYRIGEGGCIIPQPIPPEACKPKATKNDIKMLEKYDYDGLEMEGLFGVIDRLQNSGLLPGVKSFCDDCGCPFRNGKPSCYCSA